MLIKTFASSLALTTALIAGIASADSVPQETTQQVQQIRNATVKITYGDTTFLVDPMLAEQGAYPGFEGTYRSELRNPLVGLPIPAEDVIDDMDAVIVTHTHLDHWDAAAQELLPKDIPLFAQNAADAELIRSQGFSDVRILDGDAEFGGVQLHKTGGQHGTDEMYASPEVATALGDVMGVVFQAPGQETLYLVGDTIWRDEVDQALDEYDPEIVVLNTGKALRNDYVDSIIMGKKDVLRATQTAPEATIIAIHMDAINHLSLTREELREYVQAKGIQDHVVIPADGEVIPF